MQGSEHRFPTQVGVGVPPGAGGQSEGWVHAGKHVFDEVGHVEPATEHWVTAVQRPYAPTVGGGGGGGGGGAVVVGGGGGGCCTVLVVVGWGLGLSLVGSHRVVAEYVVVLVVDGPCPGVSFVVTVTS